MTASIAHTNARTFTALAAEQVERARKSLERPNPVGAYAHIEAAIRELTTALQCVNRAMTAVTPDPLAHVKVGDADPTSDVVYSDFCMVRFGFATCTRPKNHPGQHIAGGRHGVCATWPAETAPSEPHPDVIDRGDMA